MSRAFLGAAIVLVGVLTWLWIDAQLAEKKIAVSESRVMLLEVIPAFIFSGMCITFLYPAGHNLVYGTIPGFAPQGFFWDLATFLGALTMTTTGIAWVALIPDKEPDSVEDAAEQATEAS